MRNKWWYRILLWILLITSLALLLYISPTLFTPNSLAADDFGHFWAAGRLTTNGKDPYNPTEILSLLYQVGRVPDSSKVISVMLNPPWTLPIVMVFGLLSYAISRMLWLLVNIAILLFVAHRLWRIYNGPQHIRWLAWLVVFTFAPTIATLQKGQFTPLVLAGLVGFLSVADQLAFPSVGQARSWRAQVFAGCMIALIAIKPQLLFLFWLALLLWCVQHRNWLVVITAVLILVLASIFPLIFNPKVIAQYFHNMAVYPLSDWASPTIGAYLRLFWIGTDKFWPQFLPSMLGGLWFIGYWYKHHSSWSWINQLPLLIFVTALTTPYAWTYDLIILLPALIQASIWLVTKKIVWSTYLLGSLLLAISILDLVLHTKLDEFWFIWLTPVLLIWYWMVNIYCPAQKAVASV